MCLDRKCCVCDSPAFFSFYGAVVCDPCRTFFRRYARHEQVSFFTVKLWGKYFFCYLQLPICTYDGNCEIDYKTRATCTWCRYQKCLAVGMKPSMVEYDFLVRDSSSKKTWKFSTCLDPYKRRSYIKRTGTSDSKRSGQGSCKTERTVTRHNNVLNPLDFVKQPALRPATLTSLKPVTTGLTDEAEKIRDRKEECVYLKETCDANSKRLDETAINSWYCNQVPNQVLHSFPMISCTPSVNKGILWVKELHSSTISPEFLKFQMIHSDFRACESFKISLEFSLDLESHADIKFLQSISTSFKKQKFQRLAFLVPDTASLYLETNNRRVIFHRDSSSIFNVHVSSVSENELSNIIMHSLTEDHWSRLQQVISFSKILYRYTCVEHDLKVIPYSPESLIQGHSHLTRYTCLLHTSLDRECNIISKAIESLEFFPQLSIEDQFILLKDAFLPIGCLMFTHIYNEDIESYVFTALNGMLSFCSYKDRLRAYPKSQCSTDLNLLLNSILDQFLGFLREDYFVISILCIICILEEKPGLTSTDFLIYEGRLYSEILHAYINANVISYKWPCETDIIWQNIRQIFQKLARYQKLFIQFVKEEKQTKY